MASRRLSRYRAFAMTSRPPRFSTKAASTTPNSRRKCLRARRSTPTSPPPRRKAKATKNRWARHAAWPPLYNVRMSGRAPRERIHGTTVLCVRRDGKVVIAGDGQVTMGHHVMKHTARKIRRLFNDKVLAGIAGFTGAALSVLAGVE